MNFKKHIPLITILALILTGCTAKDINSLLNAENPGATLRDIANSHVQDYAGDPEKILADLKAAQLQYKKLVGIFRGEVEATWGEEEVVVPTNTDYVKYTDSYKSRAIVQFDIGLITIETLDQSNSQQSLENAIYTTLLTPDDPRAVELYTAQRPNTGNRLTFETPAPDEFLDLLQ